VIIKNLIDDYMSFLPAEIREALSKELEQKDNQVYGEIHLEGDGSDFDITMGQWELITGWNLSCPCNQVDPSGVSSLTIMVEGVYQVNAFLSFDTDSTGLYDIACFVNGNLVHNLHATRENKPPNSIRPISLTGLIQFYKDDVIELKIKLDSGNATITPDHAGLIVVGIHQP